MSGATLIIAEAGVNHNGSIERAFELVRAAKKSGADVVKFQHFRASSIVAKGTATAAYQKAKTGTADQYDLLRSLEIDLGGFEKIAACCREEGIEFLCTAFEMDAAAPLAGYGMKRMKIPSGELTNALMLRSYAGFGLPVILSTGMATLEETAASLMVLRESGAREVTLLHCTSLYPAPAAALDLRAITTMRTRFSVPVGYSDHSLGGHAALAAVALGACVIEKHLTLDCTLPGPDHQASLEPAQFAEMAARIRDVEAMLGDGAKRPCAAELETAALVRRSWHAARDLPARVVLAEGDAVLLRPASGISAMQQIMGRQLMHPVEAGRPIVNSDMGPA